MAQSVTQFLRNSAALAACSSVRTSKFARTRDAYAKGAVATLRCCHDPVVITLQALLGLFELRLAPDRQRCRAPWPLIPAKAFRRHSRPHAGRRPEARTRRCACAIECRPRTTPNHARQSNHQPQRLVHGLGVAKHARYIGIKRNASVTHGRSQTLAERGVARRTGTWRALSALVRIGPAEVARLCSRCAELAVLRRARARAAARTGGGITIFAVKTLHQ